MADFEIVVVAGQEVTVVDRIPVNLNIDCVAIAKLTAKRIVGEADEIQTVAITARLGDDVGLLWRLID